MNYRHGFHAGNFADCMKHALLLAILDRLALKPAPFLVLDTHAGTGLVELEGAQATRTGEWRAGIGRLLDDTPAPLARFATLAAATPGFYPGSPLLALAAMRAQDRLIACELHPEDAATLRLRLAGEPRASVHHRDGYEAIRALLPPREIRRGLVLIDPPFEDPAEWERLAAGILEARRRFPAGVVAAWYPIKGRARARGLGEMLVQAGVRDLVAYELLLRPPLDAGLLNGCGMLVANNPFGLEAVAADQLASLATRLGEAGGDWNVTRLAPE